MKQLLFIIFIIACCTTAHAQLYLMDVQHKNASVTTLPTDAIQKITFVPGSAVMNVQHKNGTNTAIQSEDIRNITFSATSAAYTITATAGANGGISPSGTVNVNYGADTTFTFTPNTGYHVDSVIVDGLFVGSFVSYLFPNVTANHTIRVVFAINTYTLTVTQGSNGTISPGTSIVNNGENQQFTITPNTGYHIDSVIVDNEKVDSTTSYTFVNVTANHTIRAVFKINTYTITASSGNNGNINPSGAVNVNYGADTTFTFTPNTGYHVDSVFVDGLFVGSLVGYTFYNVTATHTISVKFKINSFTITSSANGEGTISPSGNTSVQYDDTLRFTATPNSSCYKLSKIMLDGDSVASSSPYTLRNISANHSVAAYFVQKTFSVTETHGANGSVTPSGTTTVNCSDSLVYTISPGTGYRVAVVMIDGETSVGSVTSYTFRNITANHSINATFSIVQFTITASAGNNGTITPSGNVTVNYNGSQTFTITANANYKIDSVLIDGNNIDTTSSYTFSNVTSEHTIRVTFKEKNNLPVANAGSDSVEKNRTKTITLTGNDVDANDTTLTFILDAQPTHGDFQGNIISVNGTTAQVMYRPDNNYVGVDSFSFYVRDGSNARSTSATVTLTVFAIIDSNKYRSFSQSDWDVPLVKIPKKGVRPMPTAGNVLDTIFITGPFKKLKEKTNPNYPGGVVLGVVQTVKDSIKKYGWIRYIGKSGDVQKGLVQTASPSGFDKIQGKPFVKELKNPKTDKYSNQLAGELLALKANIAMSDDMISNAGFGELIFFNTSEQDTFINEYQKLVIQGRTLRKIASMVDTMLTYYKRYYTLTAPESYNDMAVTLRDINAEFQSAIDTVSVKPLKLKDVVRIDNTPKGLLRRSAKTEAEPISLENSPTLPEEILLLQNYPNPFNPTTNLQFTIADFGLVTLKVYDVLGQEVATLIHSREMDEGMYEVQFDANGLTSGVYFYRLSVSQNGIVRNSETRKLLLMK
jgi:hypothetical protein